MIVAHEIYWLTKPNQKNKKKKNKKNCHRDLGPTGVIQAQNEVFHHFSGPKIGSNWPSRAWNQVFRHFLKFGSLVSSQIA